MENLLHKVNVIEEILDVDMIYVKLRSAWYIRDISQKSF